MSSETDESVHYLFRNCEKETQDPQEGKVTGKIPPFLQGKLIRNGPGIQKIGEVRYSHLFDGMSTLHLFRISNGKVTYQSRFLESDTYKKNMEANRIVCSEFGTMGISDPCEGLFSRYKSHFTSKMEDMTDNCSVNVGFYGDQLYAMTETALVRRIDPETLKTIDGKTCLTDYIAVNTATAHPHVLPDGSVLNMGNNFRHKRGPHYCLIKVPPTFGSEETSFKEAKIIAEIPCRWKLWPCYFHSFGMSTDYGIFVEQPLCLNVIKMKIIPNSFYNNLSWYNEKSTIHLVTLENGEIKPIKYRVSNLFTFHHVNAYEEDGCLIVDISAYNDSNVLKGLETEANIKANPFQLKNNFYQGATARRLVLPLTIPSDAKVGDNLVKLKGTSATAYLTKMGKETIVDCTAQHLTKEWFEFPRINYKYNGKKYNFFYGCSSTIDDSEGGFVTDVIKKVDIKEGKELTWTLEGAICSEPVFVQNSELEEPEEDDGYLLSSIMYKNNPKKVSLLILNAKDMTQEALVDFEAKGSITATFHGLWAQNNETIHNY